MMTDRDRLRHRLELARSAKRAAERAAQKAAAAWQAEIERLEKQIDEAEK